MTRTTHAAPQAAIALLLALAAGLTHAQDNSATTVSAKQNPLPVYASPSASTPLRSVPMPEGKSLPVEATQDDFYRVRIDGQPVWVDSMTVLAHRGSTDHCTGGPGPMVAGSPGAGNNHCK
jgi:hypothetical protein